VTVFKKAGFKKMTHSEFGGGKLGYKWDTRNDPDTSYIETRK